MYFTNFRTYKSACTYFSPTQLSELCFCVYNAALFFPEKITKHIQFPVDTFMFPVRKMGVRASVCAKSTESCPVDYSPPGSSVHGILLARILKWVQFSSVVQSCPPLCEPMDCSMPGFPVQHQLPELTQNHVHQVGDAIQPSHSLSCPSPPTFDLSQHQGLLQ